MVFSTEECYSELARLTLSFIGNRYWDEGGIKAGFYNKMIHHGFYLIFNGEADERSLSQWGMK